MKIPKTKATNTPIRRTLKLIFPLFSSFLIGFNDFYDKSLSFFYFYSGLVSSS